MFQLTFKFRSHFICELRIHKNRWNHCSAKHFFFFFCFFFFFTQSTWMQSISQVTVNKNVRESLFRCGLHLWGGWLESRWVLGSL